MTSRPYSVPPIGAPGRKSPTLVDLFAGSGGLGLGLEMAGFAPVYVNELDASAMATYVGNRLRRHPDLLLNRSFAITELTGTDEHKRSRYLRDWAANLRDKHGDIGLVAGGPPCQGYSGIGHRRSFT